MIHELAGGDSQLFQKNLIKLWFRWPIMYSISVLMSLCDDLSQGRQNDVRVCKYIIQEGLSEAGIECVRLSAVVWLHMQIQIHTRTIVLTFCKGSSTNIHQKHRLSLVISEYPLFATTSIFRASQNLPDNSYGCKYVSCFLQYVLRVICISTFATYNVSGIAYSKI